MMSLVTSTWISADDIAEGTIGWGERERKGEEKERQRRRNIEDDEGGRCKTYKSESYFH